MKITKTIITAMLLLFTITSFAQNKEYKEYYDNGKLKTWGYLTPDQKKIGEWKTYHESGNFQSLFNFENDLLEGELKQYYDSGPLQFIVNYKNGKRHGEMKSYYENGKLQAEYIFKNGVEEGDAKAYFENGAVMFVGKYVNGEEKDVQFYYENGEEDNRRNEVETLLKKYLVKSEKVISIDTIFVDECDVSIYYTAQGNDPEQYIIFPTNLKEIDKDGKIKFDGYVLKEGFKYNGRYISSMSATYLSAFTVKKEGRKKIEELMRSLSKDCTQ